MILPRVPTSPTSADAAWGKGYDKEGNMRKGNKRKDRIKLHALEKENK
jgi:hypothetical protein